MSSSSRKRGAKPGDGLTCYTIAVETSNIFSAGTDAKVSIRLHGSRGESRLFDLKDTPSTNKGRKFGKGKSDVFLFTGVPSVGVMQKVTIAHDNTGTGAGWHLAYIDVHDSSANTVYHFPCHRWLAKDEDDGLISRTLTCAKSLNKSPKTPLRRVASSTKI